MLVPNYINAPFVDQNGNLTPQWSLLIDQLLRQLQINFSNEGVVVPPQNTTDVNVIASSATNGTLLFDSTTKEPGFIIDNIFYPIDLTGGSVTSITAGTGLTALPTNPITDAGTISIANSSANSLAGYNASGIFSNITVGTGLALSGNVLTSTASGGTVTSVAGDGSTISTSPNPITATGTVSIAAGYLGQTSITTLGTISIGTWNGSTIPVAYGGTGLASSPTNGQLLIGNGTGYTLATLTAGTNISISNLPGSITINSSNPGGTVTSITAGTGLTASPNPITSTGTISLTTPVSLGNGGTNASLTASNGGIAYSNASQLQILAGTSTAHQILLSGSSTTPAWSTATYPATTTANQLLYSSATNTISGLASPIVSILVTDVSGVPSFSTTLPAFTASGNISCSGNIIIGSTTNSLSALYSSFIFGQQNTGGLGTQGALTVSGAASAVGLTSGTVNIYGNQSTTATAQGILNFYATQGAGTSTINIAAVHGTGAHNVGTVNILGNSDATASNNVVNIGASTAIQTITTWGNILTGTTNTYNIGASGTVFNTVYATTFNGTTFTGNAATATSATNATNVGITSSTSNTTYYITGSAATSGNNALNIYTGLNFNPSTENLNLTGNMTISDVANGTPGSHSAAAPAPSGSTNYWFIPFDPNNPSNTLGSTSPTPPRSIRIILNNVVITGANSALTLRVATTAGTGVASGYVNFSIFGTSSGSGSLTPINGGTGQVNIMIGEQVSTTAGRPLTGFVEISWYIPASGNGQVSITGVVGTVSAGGNNVQQTFTGRYIDTVANIKALTGASFILATAGALFSSTCAADVVMQRL